MNTQETIQLKYSLNCEDADELPQIWTIFS